MNCRVLYHYQGENSYKIKIFKTEENSTYYAHLIYKHLIDLGPWHGLLQRNIFKDHKPKALSKNLYTVENLKISATTYPFK